MEDILIRFRLIGDEAKALCKLSAIETRKPRDQVRHILREALEQRGLLESERVTEADQQGPPR